MKLEIATKLGFTFLLKNKFADAFKTISPLHDLIEEKLYPRSAGRFYVIAGIKKAAIDLELKNGAKLIEKAIELSRNTNDIPALSFGVTYLGWLFLLNGEILKAKNLFCDIAPILEKRQSWYTLSIPFSTLSMIFCDAKDKRGQVCS